MTISRGVRPRRSSVRGGAATFLVAALLATVSPALSQTAPEKPVSPAQQPAPAPSATGSAAKVSPPTTEATAGTSAAAGKVSTPRITFNLTFPKKKGGGSATGSAGTLTFLRKDYAVATGSVEINYKDLKVTADRMEVDLTHKVVKASGHVIVDQGPKRLTGTTLVYDLDAETGKLTDATAFVQPDMYFSGAVIEKLGKDRYAVKHGVFTSCSGASPSWSFHLGWARVDVGAYAHIRNAAVYAKKLPVFYTPYLLWPAKTDRTSGLLVPNIGYSKYRGSYLGLAYYQVLGASYDTTVYADLYGDHHFGLGDEFRYHPSDATKGQVRGYVLRDPTTHNNEWKLSWNHVSSDLPFGMRAVVNALHYSNFDYFRNFERDFNTVTLRSIYSSAFATGNWGNSSLNILFDERKTFIDAGTDITQRQLPEIEYRLRATQLGKTPLYLNVLSSLNYLSVDRSATYKGTYGRFDLFPQLSLPLHAWPWLSVSVVGGERATYWTSSLDPATGALGNNSLERFYPTLGAQIVGPSFSRIFDHGLAGFSKLKHIVEPRFTYDFLGNFNDRNQIPLFDEVDSPHPHDIGTWSLVNRLLAKSGSGSSGSAREIMSLEISQSYSFDPNQPLERSQDGTRTAAYGPMTAHLRFDPSLALSVDSRASYSTFFGGLEATSLSASFHRSTTDFGLTWYTRYNAEKGGVASNQAQVSAGFDVIPRKLHLESQLSYNI
ncbi:MAG TPA: LPS assembly protein LptD, partial [Thermoanaerobaculia bacterium]|nr:LPS assembly protein LptD [Thermoanaerobaculia bacterium]